MRFLTCMCQSELQITLFQSTPATGLSREGKGFCVLFRHLMDFFLNTPDSLFRAEGRAEAKFRQMGLRAWWSWHDAAHLAKTCATVDELLSTCPSECTAMMKVTGFRFTIHDNSEDMTDMVPMVPPSRQYYSQSLTHEASSGQGATPIPATNSNIFSRIACLRPEVGVIPVFTVDQDVRVLGVSKPIAMSTAQRHRVRRNTGNSSACELLNT